MCKITVFCALIPILGWMSGSHAAMTMKQFEQSLIMVRKSCLQKTGATEENVDGIKKGKFPDDDKKLRCYTLCVAEMGGVLNKKKEFIEAKIKSQADTILPPELKQGALAAFDNCKNLQSKFKDPCDRTYYMAKCGYEFNPSTFFFP